jgi:hypothetical protein
MVFNWFAARDDVNKRIAIRSARSSPEPSTTQGTARGANNKTAIPQYC